MLALVPRAPAAWATPLARRPPRLSSLLVVSASKRPSTAGAAGTRKRRASNEEARSDEDLAHKHVVVVGGGAAGLTAAIFAAREAAAAAPAPDATDDAPPAIRVTVLERTSEPGKKILLSGGTRANVLPLSVTPESDFSTDSRPSALRSALAAWPLEDVKTFLEDDVGLGPLALEAESSKWFPASNSAKDVRDGLVRAAEREGAEVACGVKVSRVERRRRRRRGSGGEDDSEEKQHRPWRIWLDSDSAIAGGAVVAGAADPSSSSSSSSSSFIDADSVVLALGGSSFPKTGTDGMGYRMLARLGVPLRSPYPALTPLVGVHPAGEQLAGVTLPEARLTAVEGAAAPAAAADGSGGSNKKKKKKKKAGAAQLGSSRRGGFLFSHKGYTGPAVLDVSEHWVRAAEEEEGVGGVGGSGGGGGGAPPPPHTTKTIMRVAWTGEGEDAWAERLSGWTSGAHVATLLQRSGVPARLAAALCREAGCPNDGASPAPQLSKASLRSLARLLGAYELPVDGHRGYALAEVTGGGVPLEALDTRTMEVVRVEGGGGGGKGGRKRQQQQQQGEQSEEDDDDKDEETAARSGLHVCGELVDVHGRIGGFNFLWAWVSGRSAGRGAVASALRSG